MQANNDKSSRFWDRNNISGELIDARHRSVSSCCEAMRVNLKITLSLLWTLRQTNMKAEDRIT